MTKHVAPKPLAQKLREMTTSATRGYFFLRQLDVIIDANAQKNGTEVDKLLVAKEWAEDIRNCLYLAKEYSGSGDVMFRDIVLDFK